MLYTNGNYHEEGQEDPPNSAHQASRDALEVHEPPPLCPLLRQLQCPPSLRLEPAHSLRFLGGLRWTGENLVCDPCPIREPPSFRRIAEEGRIGVRIPEQWRLGLALPGCVFKEILQFLEKDKSRFGRLGLDELLKMVSEVGFVDSCKDSATNAGAKNSGCHAFTPLLQR
ncbi:hypothetical protein C1H46_012254 [Malus baccata]|uniref:Uncharacterized protein n=1 Tax=Malus baccata TaxID=106549 RepID=A0A540MTJ2_MALBA|nr:hypothetical protein C1H46_012254 [Malus baccata]